MKLSLVVLVAVIAVGLGEEFEFPASILPEDIEDLTFVDPDSKISGGEKIKSGENLSFGYAIISFINKVITCGVTLVDKQWAVTSARCLVDQQEGLASNASVYFPQFNKKPVLGIQFIVPDGSNGADAMMAATLEAYDNSTDIPFSTVGPNNVGMIKLKTAYTDKQLDGKKLALAKFPSSTDWATTESTYLASSAGYTLRAAGIGVIDNRGAQSKDALVTNFAKLENSDACTMTTDGTTVTMPGTDDGNGACVYNPNSDSNVCKYDFGAGLFAVKLDDKGKQVAGTTPEFLCIIVGSPNIRPNAQCLGGHKNICILTYGKVQQWILGVIAGRVVPA